MSFPSIRIEGSILSGELLARLDSADFPGQRHGDFSFDSAVRLKEDILRAWTHAQNAWRMHNDRLDAQRASKSGITETRNFIEGLFGLLGYAELEYDAQAEMVGDKPFRFTHRLRSHGAFPVHIVGARESLDRKPEGTGQRVSPHAHVQEYLNLTEHLYALVTNGRLLRLLRDSTRLVKLSYVEFDLDRIFGEELFADFAVLYRLLHVSRLPKSPDTAAGSLLENYHQDALESGARIRDGLSGAVKATILDLASGFLNHPANEALRALAAAPGFPAQLYPQLLLLVYRLLFLMVIEERDLIFPAGSDAKKRALYYAHYSLARLRRLAEKRHLADLRHTDGWAALCSTFRLFDETGVGHPLGVEPLGGDLFDSKALGPLSNATLDNATLLGCLRNLAVFRDRDTGQLIRANYKHLDVEEFGSVYQGLLEYEPQIVPALGRLNFAFAAGDERSRTGSHYTPEELVQPLLKHSLDYLIADAVKKTTVAEKERTLLALKVCDVACGSGHILLAAARRIGAALAVLRTGDDQPSPATFREAVRDVIRHCIYGMDLNPLAVELCKVALWLEAHVPGQPLTFLDHRIHCGNAIVGLVRADELKRGIPDEAFKTLPGDDKDIAAALRRQNKDERIGEQSLDFGPRVADDIKALRDAYSAFEHVPEQGAGDYYKRRAAYDRFVQTEEHKRLCVLSDLQVAQFYLPKTRENASQVTTHDTFRRWLNEDSAPKGPQPLAAMSVAGRKRFAHWFIELWDVMNEGGFNLIIGNPPYLMNRKLSGSFGDAFLEWVKFEYAPAGSVDLVTYFFRRIFDLVRSDGFMALISTNTIAQGAAREGGLDVIRDRGGTINFANRAQQWPGQAAVSVAMIVVHKGPWIGPFLLDGKSVPRISTYLDDAESIGDPLPLIENADRSFIGSYVLGMGFVLKSSEASSLLQAEPKLNDVLFPYVGGEDFNSHPEQCGSRWVVNFFDWTEERCRTEYPTAFAILEEKVKPERTRKNDNGEFALRKPLPERWWLYADKRPKLYATIAHFERVLAAPLVSKYVSFAFVPRRQVFAHKLAVFAYQDYAAFAILQSDLHTTWAWRYSSTMRNFGINYAPSDCFLTFPFPRDSAHEAALAAIGEAYHEHRRVLMHDLWLGLTDLYNLFHRPDLTDALIAGERGERTTIDGEEGFTRLLRLRELHFALNTAVLAAYGWDRASDFGPALNLRHDFRAVDNLPENDRTRYTLDPEARREVLARLLKLNHLRAADAEREETAVAIKPKRKPKQSSAVARPEFDLGLDLFGRPVPIVAQTAQEFASFSEAYPAGDADRLVCAFALDLVAWREGLSSQEHLDALILITHPELCRVLMEDTGAEQLDTWGAGAKAELKAVATQGLKWVQCLRYLEEHRKALSPARNEKERPIRAGSHFDSTRASFPCKQPGISVFALGVLDSLRDRRQKHALSPEQNTAFATMGELHSRYAVA